jgi:predicted DNA-binding transcriptional regulator AlpA
MAHDGHDREDKRAALPRRLLRRERAALYLDISPPSFDKLRRAGILPPPRMLEGFRVWDSADLDRYIEQLPYEGEQADDYEAELDRILGTAN